MAEIAKCEGCEQEKDVTDIEGHILCDECSDDIVRCSFCKKLLATAYDDLETNAGPLIVPTLSLPDEGENLIFCDICCLEEYIQKYKREKNVLEKMKKMKWEQ
jgi:predicted RNA-binding Zn-ribbon protein involved in translation (DUF1610 family)